MAIRVEFFGIARHRAGRAAVELDLQGGSLANVLNHLQQQVPGFEACLHEGQLHPTLAANLEGRQFISDPNTFIIDGQTLLILSADAGG
jgi:molybdopterin converting factor small subunit